MVVDVTTLTMAVKLQKENPAGCAGEGEEIRNKDKDGLKITDNSIM